MQRSIAFGLILVACTFLSPRAAAQTLTRVTPEVGAPGDTVLISGTNLGGTSTVRFGANVGGFAGFWVVQVAPVQVTPTLVTAVVPVFGNFLPGGLPLGSTPVGTVDVGGGGFANSLPFFYLEQTAGVLDTPGLGTTLGGLVGRPVVGFQIAGGAPVPGNAGFTLTLENAVPAGTATLALGSPATPPGTSYLDGFVGIDLNQPFQLLAPSFTVNASGDVAWNLPIPGGPLNVTIAVVWVVVDPVTGGVGISDGLKVTL
jgi:hypothetical protein